MNGIECLKTELLKRETLYTLYLIQTGETYN